MQIESKERIINTPLPYLAFDFECIYPSKKIRILGSFVWSVTCQQISWKQGVGIVA